MSLSATLFGRNSLIFKATNVMGLGIPGWLDKAFGAPEQEGVALGEIAQQTAKEAEPRVIVWGRVRPIGGNIMHAQKPVTKWVKVKSQSGGKGGGGDDDTVKEQHVFRTYAIGVCEGPITAFSRIWRNNKLVYDGRGTDWGARNNAVFLKKVRLYYGGWDQPRDSWLQAIWGADIPAYRGTAYIVVHNEDLTDMGGSIPQYLFEVERAEGVYFTSEPYRMEQRDALASEPGITVADIRGPQITAPQRDALAPTPGVVSIGLTDPIHGETDYVAPVPAITQIVLGEPIGGADDYLAPVPAVTEITLSITYDKFKFEGVAVVPACTEVGII